LLAALASGTVAIVCTGALFEAGGFALAVGASERDGFAASVTNFPATAFEGIEVVLKVDLSLLGTGFGKGGDFFAVTLLASAFGSTLATTLAADFVIATVFSAVFLGGETVADFAFTDLESTLPDTLASLSLAGNAFFSLVFAASLFFDSDNDASFFELPCFGVLLAAATFNFAFTGVVWPDDFGRFKWETVTASSFFIARQSS